MWCIGENLPYDSLRDGTAPSGRSGPCSPAAGVSQASGSTCNYMRQPPETSLGVQRFFLFMGDGSHMPTGAPMRNEALTDRHPPLFSAPRILACQLMCG